MDILDTLRMLQKADDALAKSLNLDYPSTLNRDAANEIESLRAKLAAAEKDAEMLRVLLAVIYCPSPALYSDDGELQDSRERPHIDFRRDSVADIEAKMRERGRRKLSAAIAKEKE